MAQPNTILHKYCPRRWPHSNINAAPPAWGVLWAWVIRQTKKCFLFLNTRQHAEHGKIAFTKHAHSVTIPVKPSAHM